MGDVSEGGERRTLHALGRRDVQRICSGQSVVDLATAVKELVENALDAGATQIEVKLQEFGRDALEVADNGSGVAPDDRAALARKHYTSKIERFEDIERLASFGFRGEALSSICELAGSFSVCTRTAAEEIGALLVFDSSGTLVRQSKKARPVGTTVVVEDLFKPLAVRHKDFRRNIKKHYARLLKAMQGYALSCTNVRLSVVNSSGKAGGRQVVLATQAHRRTGDNIASVFGTKFFRTLVPVEFVLDDVWPSGDAKAQRHSRGDAGSGEDSDGEALSTQQEEEPPVRATPGKSPTRERQVIGYVSKVGAGVGRSDNDRQFFFINGRPFDLPKVAKATNEVWRQYEMKQKPACVLNFLLPLGDFDVNVTPDKRETFLKHEADIVHAFKTKLNSLYEPTRGTFLVQPLLSSFSQPGPPQDLVTRDATASNQSSRASSASTGACSVVTTNTGSTDGGSVASHEEQRDQQRVVPAAATETAKSVYAIVDILAPGPIHTAKDGEGEKDSVADTKSPTHKPGTPATASHDCCSPLQSSSQSASASRSAVPAAVQADNPSHHQQRRRRSSESRSGQLDSESRRQSIDSDASGRKKRRISSLDDQGVSSGGAVLLAAGARLAMPESQETNSCWSFAEMRRQRQAFFTEQVQDEAARQQVATARAKVPAVCSVAGPSQEADDGSGGEDAAAAALQRVLKKEDFQRMHVLGQFNLGFIIGKLDSDLFIIDQHASDEKFNYETLQRTTVMHQQPLVRPLPLELTAGEEMVVMDHQDVFAKNGFTFQVDKHAPATRKLKLLSLPFSKHTQFGTEDIRELASLLMDTPAHHASTIRLPKVAAMFASRACRSSVMIGTALHKEEMQKIVRNLSGLDQPWNCPHGRPTLRHLVDLEHLEQQQQP